MLGSLYFGDYFEITIIIIVFKKLEFNLGLGFNFDFDLLGDNSFEGVGVGLIM